METAEAKLKQYRQSPRKVRLVADFIRGKQVKKALGDLSALPKRASETITKLLKSAMANAKEKGLAEESLFVKEVRVDKGLTLSRWQPASRGRAHPINKRTSHVRIVLAERKDK